MQPEGSRKPDGLEAAYLDHVYADQINIHDENFEDELIESVLLKDGMSVVYGDSNSGKTFLAIDLACAIGRGCRWLGRRSVQGVALYLATEGPRSVQMRLKAYKKHHGVQTLPLVVVTSPVNFFQGGQADSHKVVVLIKKIEAQLGQKVRVVIGDTMARISAGANENTGQDMTIVLKHADYIREHAQIHFMWIHHCGKDAAKGGRGWSGIRAAIDTEIEVVEAKGQKTRSVEITKQRDIDGKGDRYGFTLMPVPIGMTQWGRIRSSCVVVEADAPNKAANAAKHGIETAIMEFFAAEKTSASRNRIVDFVVGLPRNKGVPPNPGSVYNKIAAMVKSGVLVDYDGIIQPSSWVPENSSVISYRER